MMCAVPVPERMDKSKHVKDPNCWFAVSIIIQMWGLAKIMQTPYGKRLHNHNYKH